MEKLLSELEEQGFLLTKDTDGGPVMHLYRPCRITVSETVVEELRNAYIPGEEIGGVFWAKPSMNGIEREYVLEKVSFIRNAIEDKRRTDEMNKSNTYFEDPKDKAIAYNAVFASGCLPIDFHTHPTKGKNFFQSILNFEFQTDLSEQDKKESYRPITIGSKKLLMPRALMVGNELRNREIFIGVYNGYISPTGFEVAKVKVQRQNSERAVNFFGSIKLTEFQVVIVLICVLVFIYLLFRYPKVMVPMLLAAGTLLPSLMINTESLSDPEYFNRLTAGKGNIYIP